MSAFSLRARRVVASAAVALAAIAGAVASPAPAGALATTPAGAVSAVSVVSAVSTGSSMPGGVVLVHPSRILDTRVGRGAPAGAVPSGQSRSVAVAGVAGVPATGVGAVLVSITVTASTGDGRVTAYASGQSVPGTSNVNYVAGQTVTNLALVPVGPDGRIALSVSGGAVQLIGDVSGWVAAGPATDPGAVAPLPPARLLDTRSGVGAPAARVTGPAVVHLTVAGRGGVPATGASAALLNVTAVSPTRAGNVAVTPVDTGSASTSALNFPAGRTVSNLVVARLSPTGTVDLRVSSGVTVDLLADVLGAVVAGDPSADGGLVTAAPQRILDTRAGSPVEPGTAFPLYTPVPHGSAAAVVNVTVVGATGNGFLTVSAPGTGTPKVSQLSFARGSTVAAQVLAPVDAGGWVRLTVAPSSRVHLVVDLAGWVLGPQDAASVPPTVSAPTVSSSGSAVALRWTAPSGINAGYVVRRRIGDTAPASPYEGVAIGAPFTASFTDTRVAPGVTYSYAVFARDPSGNLSEAVPLTATTPAQGWGGRVPLPARQGSPAAVSCPTTTWCMVGDEAGAAMTYNGSSWSGRTQVLPQNGDEVRGFTDVSCPSTAFCLGALTIGGYAVYRSGTWTVTAADARWSSVDCYSATRCALVGEVDAGARAGFWNGTSVGTLSGPSGFDRLRSVSCPTATLCWAAGTTSTGSVRVMRASGTTWSASTLASSSGYNVVEVSCTSGTFCMVTSSDSSRAWRWNGTSWARIADTRSNLIVNVDSLSCASPTSCQGVGDGRVARWNGSTWTVTELTRYVTPSMGWRNRVVDCASASMCLLVDTKGRFNRWNGSSWGPMTLFDRTFGVLGELTCASRSRCMVGDALGSVLTWNGSTWSGPTTISESGSLLSCPTSTWCLAVDQQSGTFRKWTGAWGSTTTFDNVNFYSTLSCASPNACFLFQGGELRRFNGTSWSAPATLFPNWDGNTTVRIVCATSTSCLAVDTWTGRYARWNGSSWSKPASSGLRAIFDLTCVSASMCMGLGESSTGAAVTARFDGSAWRQTATPWSPSRLACQSATRCVATGYDGSTLWMWDGLEWGQTATTVPAGADLACRGAWCMATANGAAAWTP